MKTGLKEVNGMIKRKMLWIITEKHFMRNVFPSTASPYLYIRLFNSVAAFSVKVNATIFSGKIFLLLTKILIILLRSSQC